MSCLGVRSVSLCVQVCIFAIGFPHADGTRVSCTLEESGVTRAMVAFVDLSLKRRTRVCGFSSRVPWNPPPNAVGDNLPGVIR